MQKTDNVKKIIIFVGIAVVVFVGVFVGITLTKNVGKTPDEITMEDAGKQMQKLLDGVNVVNVTPRKAAISDEDILSDEDELPDIQNYPFTVTGTGSVNIEIFSSPEKAGTGTDGWINEVAENFNNSNIQVNGKTASVSIRSISSGLAVDYIKSHKA